MMRSLLTYQLIDFTRPGGKRWGTSFAITALSGTVLASSPYWKPTLSLQQAIKMPDLGKLLSCALNSSRVIRGILSSSDQGSHVLIIGLLSNAFSSQTTHSMKICYSLTNSHALCSS